jgi:hypothetical protein
MPGVIRNAVIHIQNEQPLVCDLFERPSPGDVGLICTNLRDLAGKRPIFIDDSKSIFFFPYAQVRFLEILPGSDGTAPAQTDDPAMVALGAGNGSGPEPEADADLEIDEDFLRRIREV